MTLSGYVMLKSVFGQQGCRALIFVSARLSCYSYFYVTPFIDHLSGTMVHQPDTMPQYMQI